MTLSEEYLGLDSNKAIFISTHTTLDPIHICLKIKTEALVFLYSNSIIYCDCVFCISTIQSIRT